MNSISIWVPLVLQKMWEHPLQMIRIQMKSLVFVPRPRSKNQWTHRLPWTSGRESTTSLSSAPWSFKSNNNSFSFKPSNKTAIIIMVIVLNKTRSTKTANLFVTANRLFADVPALLKPPLRLLQASLILIKTKIIMVEATMTIMMMTIIRIKRESPSPWT